MTSTQCRWMSCTLSSVSNRTSSVLESSCAERKRLSCDTSVCGRHSISKTHRAAFYLVSTQQSVGMAASFGPTRRCNGVALLLTSLTDFANKIGDQRRPASGGRPRQIIISHSLVSYKLTTMTCRRLYGRRRLRLFAGRTQVALNSGNYRAGGRAPLARMPRHDVSAELRLRAITSRREPVRTSAALFRKKLRIDSIPTYIGSAQKHNRSEFVSRTYVLEKYPLCWVFYSCFTGAS